MLKKFWVTSFVLFCIFLITVMIKQYVFLPDYLKGLEKQDHHDKHFVLVIPANNCSEITHKIFQSLQEQTYQNYQVIFIDDGSNDKTYHKANDLLNLYKCSDRFTIIQNKKRKGSVECLFEQVQKLNDDDIVVFFEGNCWLADSMVLHRFNELFKKYDVWLAYSQHANYRTKEKGKCIRVTSQNFFSNSMRRKPWFQTRLKCFYAGLFKKIHIGDFFFRGKFIHDQFDSAYMFPMMEMAKNHVAFLPEIQCHYIQAHLKDNERPSYLHNRKCQNKIISTTAYLPLSKPPYQEQLNQKASPDILIFSYDRPLQLFALLESIQTKLKEYHEIAVLYKASSDRFESSYDMVKTAFPNIHFFQQSNSAQNDFKPLVMEILQKTLVSDHIIFSVDDMIIKQPVNLKNVVNILEKSNAFFFSLRLGHEINYCYMGGYPQTIPEHVNLTNDVMAWQIDSARGDWNYYYSIDMTLYRKKDVMDIFPNISFNNPSELEPAWEKASLKKNKSKAKYFIGLSYQNSKALNIPLNIVSPANNKSMNLYSKYDLLEMFEEGLKIDIEPIASLNNTSAHVEHEPIFIQR